MTSAQKQAVKGMGKLVEGRKAKRHPVNDNQRNEYLAQMGRIRIRLVAYRPMKEPLPEGYIRVVVQAVDAGEPIVEDPVYTENLPRDLFESGLNLSRQEGWDIQPWPVAS